MNGWLSSSDFSFFLTPPLLVFLWSPISILLKFSSFFYSQFTLFQYQRANVNSRREHECCVARRLPKYTADTFRIPHCKRKAAATENLSWYTWAFFFHSRYSRKSNWSKVLKQCLGVFFSLKSCSGPEWNNFLGRYQDNTGMKRTVWTGMKEVWKHRFESSSVFTLHLLGASPITSTNRISQKEQPLRRKKSAVPQQGLTTLFLMPIIESPRHVTVFWKSEFERKTPGRDQIFQTRQYVLNGI